VLCRSGFLLTALTSLHKFQVRSLALQLSLGGPSDLALCCLDRLQGRRAARGAAQLPLSMPYELSERPSGKIL
jgi:hypothetical protein